MTAPLRPQSAEQFWNSLPHCCGYPFCDGDLEGHPHSQKCPLFGRKELSRIEFAEAYARVAAPQRWTDQDLYDAYLHGCEDDCLPEPLDKETFLASWEDVQDVQ
jgi:hypothetical protein